MRVELVRRCSTGSSILTSTPSKESQVSSFTLSTFFDRLARRRRSSATSTPSSAHRRRSSATSTSSSPRASVQSRPVRSALRSPSQSTVGSRRSSIYTPESGRSSICTNAKRKSVHFDLSPLHSPATTLERRLANRTDNGTKGNDKEACSPCLNQCHLVTLTTSPMIPSSAPPVQPFSLITIGLSLTETSIIGTIRSDDKSQSPSQITLVYSLGCPNTAVETYNLESSSTDSQLFHFEIPIQTSFLPILYKTLSLDWDDPTASSWAADGTMKLEVGSESVFEVCFRVEKVFVQGELCSTPQVLRTMLARRDSLA